MPHSDIEKLSYDYREEVGDPTELSTEHHAYLMKRHGSVVLDPIPSKDPLDPLNWSSWKKNYEIFL